MAKDEFSQLSHHGLIGVTSDPSKARLAVGTVEAAQITTRLGLLEEDIHSLERFSCTGERDRVRGQDHTAC